VPFLNNDDHKTQEALHQEGNSFLIYDKNRIATLLLPNQCNNIINELDKSTELPAQRCDRYQFFDVLFLTIFNQESKVTTTISHDKNKIQTYQR